LVAAIDPVNLIGDRCWHEIRLEIPESPSGNHQVTLETRAVGNSVDYRWALWREPQFVWRSAVAPAECVFEKPPIKSEALEQETKP
jgi:hypothetical protein